MRSPAAVALDAYLMPLFGARATRIGMLLFILVLGLLAALKALGTMGSSFLPEGFTATAMAESRKFLIIPGLPIAAVLFSELPLRDGIRQRTLLYALLSPVPRRTLALVRTVATALLLGVGGAVLILVTRVLEGVTLEPAGREIFAQMLSAFAFTGLFGLMHLLAQRGLFAGMVYFLVIDSPLAQVPFAVRRLSLSYHVRVIAGLPADMEMPVPITPPPDSFVMSVVVLAAAAALFTLAAAHLFRGRNLPELC